MRKHLTFIVLAMCALLEFPQAFSQNVSYGFSVNHGFSVLSNKQKMVSDQIDAYYYPPSNIRPIGLWQSSSMMIDSYWDQKRIVFSFGLNVFRYGSLVDSVRSLISTAAIYGQLKEKNAIVLPSFHFAYRVSLSQKLFYTPSITFGVVKVFSRYKSEALAYHPSEQAPWDEYDRSTNGLFVQFDPSAMIIELRNSIVYDLGRWSFSGGASYNIYRRLPIKGYHGFNLNAGCSVRFRD